MIRRLVIPVIVALLPGLAGAQGMGTLETDLHRFVDAFELAEVPPESQARLRAVVDHPSASHVAKMVEIHDILKRHDALRHVDMHGVQPTLYSELRQ